MSDTRQRFLREIAERVDPEQIVEVHLFQPMRHGGRETGVAVVAVDPALSAEAGGDATAPDPALVPTGQPPENSYPIDTNVPEAGDEPVVDGSRVTEPRLTVYRAQYRHTLKGPERGRWELELVAEADAPLLAVDDVVRGVHRRAGEEIEPERLNGEAFRAALREERWSASPR